MSAVPQVSVVMPAFNAAKTIGIAIQSVLDQTFTNWELLIINDGSTDGTLEIVAQFNDPRIYTITQVNQGVATARNAGLNQARGRYIAFLDSDDLWSPQKLQKQVSIFENSTDKLCLVYTKHRGFIEDINKSFSMDIDTSIGFDNDYHRLLIIDFVPTLTVMIKASIIKDVGFFRADLHGTEDWDYWIRIAKSYCLERVNEELAFYRIGSNSLSRNKDRHALEELKVLDWHLSKDQNIPKRVCHMARSFWCVKKIRHQLRSGNVMNAFTSFKQLLGVRPFFLSNFYFLLSWSFVFTYNRILLKLLAGK
jgi:glycosyltransferase involved in cell wall biosynthesis